MRRFRTLFLDAGGVLVQPAWREVTPILARHGIEADPHALTAAEPRARRDLDDAAVIQATGDSVRAGRYFEGVLRYAGVRAPSGTVARVWDEVRARHDRRNLWSEVPGGVVGALDRLRAAGYPIVVVSNANGTVRALLGEIGLGGYFADVIDSTEVGVEKPDPRIFEIALARAGADAASTLHVGDLYHVDVLGARAAGIEAWLLDSADLYADHDCVRVRSLAELAERLGA